MLLERTATSLERDQDLFECVNDSVITRTIDGRISTWNHSAEGLYGWRKEEAIGRISHELLRTQFPRPLQEIDAELVRDGRWEGKLVHTTRHGLRVVVQSRWTLDLTGQSRAVVEINVRSTDCAKNPPFASRARIDLPTKADNVKQVIDKAFAGKTAIVTGGGSGVGKAIAMALAAKGADLCLLGRNETALVQVGRSVEGPNRVRVYRCDLSVPEQIEKFAADFKRDFDSVDFLIHCAAIIALGPTQENSVDALDQQFSINVRGPYALTQSFLPLLRSSRGQIVFINSTAGLSAGPNVGQYAATKHALKAITDSLREEVNSDGIRVLSVFNGRTATPMQAAVHAVEGRAYCPEKLIQPDDIASVVIHALSLPRTAEITDVQIRPFAKLGAMSLPLLASEMIDTFVRIASGG
jgi:PAS domain S-box-containing protein